MAPSHISCSLDKQTWHKCTVKLLPEDQSRTKSPVYRVSTTSKGKSPTIPPFSIQFDAVHFVDSTVKFVQVQTKPHTGASTLRRCLLKCKDASPLVGVLHVGQTKLYLQLESLGDLYDWIYDDSSLPFDSDPRLFHARAQRQSHIAATTPHIPASLQNALTQTYCRGDAIVFFSADEFVNHLLLSAIPKPVLLVHGAYRLDMATAVFEAVRGWKPTSVVDMLGKLTEDKDKTYYGNVQVELDITPQTDGAGISVHTGSITSDYLEDISKSSTNPKCYLHELKAEHALNALLAGGKGANRLEQDATDIDKPDTADSDTPDAAANKSITQNDPNDRVITQRDANVITQINSRVPWLAPFHEFDAKLFAADKGVTMAGHRDCVAIGESCVQLCGYKLLLCDSDWENSEAFVHLYKGEAKGTAETVDEGVGAPKEGITIPLDEPNLSDTQKAFLQRVPSIAMLGPGDVGCFNASNYHLASNDICGMSVAMYVAFINWASLRRVFSVKDYWMGSNDWVPTGEMVEHALIEHNMQLLEQAAKGKDAWLEAQFRDSQERQSVKDRVSGIHGFAKYEIDRAKMRLYEVYAQESPVLPYELVDLFWRRPPSNKRKRSDAKSANDDTNKKKKRKSKQIDEAHSPTPPQHQHESLLETSESLLPVTRMFEFDSAQQAYESGRLVDRFGNDEPALETLNEWGVSLDEDGMGLLLQWATMKFMDGRQLDHAFAQFMLANMLCAHLHGGSKSGYIQWNAVATLCAAVEFQLRRMRETELPTGIAVADVSGGLVAPKIAPNDADPACKADLGLCLNKRLDEAVDLLDEALSFAVTPIDPTDGSWPPTREDVLESGYMAILLKFRRDRVFQVLDSRLK